MATYRGVCGHINSPSDDFSAAVSICRDRQRPAHFPGAEICSPLRRLLLRQQRRLDDRFASWPDVCDAFAVLVVCPREALLIALGKLNSALLVMTITPSNKLPAAVGL